MRSVDVVISKKEWHWCCAGWPLLHEKKSSLNQWNLILNSSLIPPKLADFQPSYFGWGDVLHKNGLLNGKFMFLDYLNSRPFFGTFFISMIFKLCIFLLPWRWITNLWNLDKKAMMMRSKILMCKAHQKKRTPWYTSEYYFKMTLLFIYLEK